MNHVSFSVVTPPSVECVSLIEMKDWLRANQQLTDEDELISSLITAAREHIEGQTARATLASTYLQTLDRPPLLPNSQYTPGNPALLTPVLQNSWPLSPSAWAVFLQRSPLISVQSVVFLDNNGNPQTMDPSQYFVDGNSEPPRVMPVAESYWPSTYFGPNALQITFTSGYAAPALVPSRMKTAIKMLAAHFYEHREAVSEARLAENPLALKTLIESVAVQWQWE